LQQHYGHQLRILHWQFDQTVSGALAQMDLTAAQGHVMSFIAHRQTPPCARDIEEAFQLTHPTVSGILSRLEQKEFIELRPDERDRRCKRIYMLDKGEQLHETMHQIIRATEEQLVENFTEEEKAQFASFLQRAIDNLGGNPYKRKQKEEPKK
jgi:DNA-binding MarR family transcriptional regulator